MRAKPEKPKPSPEMKFGDVCPGWTATSWAHELRRKADRCEKDHPDKAEQYRNWANELDPRNKK